MATFTPKILATPSESADHHGDDPVLIHVQYSPGVSDKALTPHDLSAGLRLSAESLSVMPVALIALVASSLTSSSTVSPIDSNCHVPSNQRDGDLLVVEARAGHRSPAGVIVHPPHDVIPPKSARRRVVESTQVTKRSDG
ncbi:MAG: hypothetical protein J2P17_11470 [Mycobacterium sp.]|nr:hypothetical protein [Mycobacterium sp.]